MGQLITPQLVAFLRERFPDRCPDVQMPDREVWFASGQASVVRFLQCELDRIEAEQLEGL